MNGFQKGQLGLVAMGVLLMFTGCSKEQPTADSVGADSTVAVAVVTGAVSDSAKDSDNAMLELKELHGAVDSGGCCEQEGSHDECWWEDAAADGVDCQDDADCTNAEICHKEGTATVGLCTCGTETCGSDGGICGDYTLSPDYNTGDPLNVCMPSYCNGFYICSCLGGCVWWDGNNLANTPADNAAALPTPLSCCEGTYGYDGNLGFFGNSSCSTDSGPNTDTDACASASECDDGNSCTVDECLITNGHYVCHNTVQTGAECDADGQNCTIDRCDTDGSCTAAVAPRCPEDTYLDGSVVVSNTCTTDCVEDAGDADSDGNTYSCYVPLSAPSDTDVKPNTPACDYWTCSTAGPTVEPENIVVDCSSLNTVCNTYACDIAGAQDNCAAVTPNIGTSCTSSVPSNLCLSAECQDPDSDSVATCEDYDVPPPGVMTPDTDVCVSPECEPTSGTWSWLSDNVGGACDDTDNCTTTDLCTSGGTCEGTVVDCSGINDACNTYSCNAVGTEGNCDGVAYSASGTSCPDVDGLSCTVEACDGAGTCTPTAVSCSGDPECNQNVCLEVTGSCVSIEDASETGGPCTMSIPPNCTSVCQAQIHSDATLAGDGQTEGICSLGVGTNDSCAGAIGLHDFAYFDYGPYGTEGSTECTSDQHQSNNTNCLVSSAQMGSSGRDAVYSFSYLPHPQCTGSDVCYVSYVIKVESAFDSVVYARKGGCSAAGAIASQDCVDPASGTNWVENTCQAPFDCDAVDGSYAADMSTVVIHEAQTDGNPQTVHVFVDSQSDVENGMFYVSVERVVGCPEPSTWYSGTIHDASPTPINGSFTDTEAGNDGISVAEVEILSGNTQLTSSKYNGEMSDASFWDYDSNDELWELDPVTAGTKMFATFCDYGGSLDPFLSRRTFHAPETTACESELANGATAGVAYNNTCWFLGDTGQSCEDVCAALSSGAAGVDTDAVAAAGDAPDVCTNALNAAGVTGTAAAQATGVNACCGVFGGVAGYENGGCDMVSSDTDIERLCACDHATNDWTVSSSIPQLRLFDCYGNPLPMTDEGESGCEDLSYTAAEDKPLYLMIDGKYTSSNYPYDVSVHYEPTYPDVIMDCTAVSGAGGASIFANLPDSGGNFDVGALDYYPAGCIEGDFKDGCNVTDVLAIGANSNIQLYANASLSQNCDNNGNNGYSVPQSSYSSCYQTEDWSNQNCNGVLANRTVCFPLHIKFTIIIDYEDGAGNVLETHYLNDELEQNNRDGSDIDLPLADMINAEFDGSYDRDLLILRAINMNVYPRQDLTADQKLLCKNKCQETSNFYVGLSPNMGSTCN